MDMIKEQILNLEITFGVYRDKEGKIKIAVPLLALNIIYIKYLYYTGSLTKLIHNVGLQSSLDEIGIVVSRHLPNVVKDLVENNKSTNIIHYTAFEDLITYQHAGKMQYESKTVTDFLSEPYSQLHAVYFTHLLCSMDESIEDIKLRMAEFLFGVKERDDSNIITEHTKVKFKDVLPFLHTSFYMQLFAGTHEFLNRCVMVAKNTVPYNSTIIAPMQGEFSIKDSNNLPESLLEKQNSVFAFKPIQTDYGYGDSILDGITYGKLYVNAKAVVEHVKDETGKSELSLSDFSEEHREFIKLYNATKEVIEETQADEQSTNASATTSHPCEFWHNVAHVAPEFSKHGLPYIEHRFENSASDPISTLHFNIFIGEIVKDEDDGSVYLDKHFGSKAYETYLYQLNDIYKITAVKTQNYEIDDEMWPFFLAGFDDYEKDVFDAIECIQIILRFEFHYVSVIMRNSIGENVALHVCFKTKPKTKGFH